MASPKRSLKKAEVHALTGRQTGKTLEYVHEIKDSNFGVFKVKNSANAWWLDLSKVQRLIDAFKIGATDEEACVYAGVMYKTFHYFETIHPEFSDIKKALKKLPTILARQTLVKAIESDPGAAFKYLERKERNEFGQNVDITTGGQALGGNKIEFVDFHDTKD